MKRDNIFIAIIVATIILAIFVLGMLTEKNINYQTKYEYYTKDGEKGTTYKCEVTENYRDIEKYGARCEIDGNMVEVAQFSEAE